MIWNWYIFQKYECTFLHCLYIFQVCLLCVFIPSAALFRQYNFLFNFCQRGSVSTHTCYYSTIYTMLFSSSQMPHSVPTVLLLTGQNLFKGTVPQDFYLPIVFTKPTHLGLWLACWSIFEYGFDFAEIFESSVRMLQCFAFANITAKLRQYEKIL